MISNIGYKLPSGVLRLIGFISFYKSPKNENWKSLASRIYENTLSVVRICAWIAYFPIVVYDKFFIKENMRLLSTLCDGLSKCWIVAMVIFYSHLKAYPLSVVEGYYNLLRKRLPKYRKNELRVELWTCSLFCLCHSYYILQCFLTFRNARILPLRLIIIYSYEICGTLALYNFNCLFYYHSKQISNEMLLFAENLDEFKYSKIHFKGILKKTPKTITDWKKVKSKLLLLQKFTKKIIGYYRTPLALFFLIDTLFILSTVTKCTIVSEIDVREIIFLIEPCYKVVLVMHACDLIQLQVREVQDRLEILSAKTYNDEVLKEISKMGSILKAFPRISFFGYFVIGRHNLLPVLSCFMSYFIIGIQFRYSFPSNR